MLSTPEAVDAVYQGERGLLAGVTAGKAVVDCATLTPEVMAASGQAVTARGGRFLEAPVSGSKVPAETGTLIFLAAGDEGLYGEVKEELAAMGKAAHYYGSEVGKGTVMKLAVNMTMGSMLVALGEGMALCKGAGLSEADLVTVLDQGACSNPMYRIKGPAMIEGKFDPHFPLKHAQKDMRFATGLGDALGVSLPVAAAANATFIRARGDHADDDMSAVYTATAAGVTAPGGGK
jgi:3-hydroxyisobutyrate dehydrogenase-like beta-hydroxyacid dehydrogenase